MAKLMFSQLNDQFQKAFETEDTVEAYKNVSFDLANGIEIFDEEGNAVPKKEAEKKLLDIQLKMFGLTPQSTKRDRKRAMAKYKNDWFAVNEEVIDIKVETGFRESEFFNNFVEMRNIARGDSQEFWTDEKVVLSVAKIAGDHHDFS